MGNVIAQLSFSAEAQPLKKTLGENDHHHRQTHYAALATLQDLDSDMASSLMNCAEIEALQIARPALDQLAYAQLVRALVAAPRFMSDFSRANPAVAFNLLVDRLLGPGSFLAARVALTDELLRVEQFATRLVQGPRLLISMRNWFAPGDLVWHVDRSRRERAIRILWPLGRAEGMRVTRVSNIDVARYAAFMRREHPLLCRLDRDVARSGVDLERLWAHRPSQVSAMIHDDYPFIIDAALTWKVDRDALSVHRIETPSHGGTFHRSAWANRSSPGLQIIMTATSD